MNTGEGVRVCTLEFADFLTNSRLYLSNGNFAELGDLFQREACEQGVRDLGLGGGEAVSVAQNGIGEVDGAVGVGCKDKDADRGAILGDHANGSDEDLQGTLGRGAAECEAHLLNDRDRPRCTR